MATQILFVGKIDSRLERTWSRLEAKGYKVTSARSRKGALELVEADPPHVVVVDMTAPRTGAEKLCRSLKSHRPEIPVVLLVDDEHPRPRFPYDEALSRRASYRKLYSVLSRVLEEHRNKVLRVGSLSLDLTTLTVRSLKGTCRLRPKEAQLLATFMRHAGEVVTREFLMKTIWETDYCDDLRTLWTHVCSLRKAIEPEQGRRVYLHTIRGIGYRLDVWPPPAGE